MTASASLAPRQVRAAAAVDALDLEPVAFGLMHPYPGLTVMSAAEADQLTTAYRRWLKLCAWYPAEPLVPTLPIGDAWLAHLTDTAKYALDCQRAFGAFAHCRPRYGSDTRQDDAWHHACQQTLRLFRRHFGVDMPGIAIGHEEAHPDAWCCSGWSGCVLILGAPGRREADHPDSRLRQPGRDNRLPGARELDGSRPVPAAALH